MISKSRSTRWVNVLPMAVASVLALNIASAQSDDSFPRDDVEMTLLFGGTAEAIGHLLSDLMTEELGAPVVAVSRTGGGGAIGYKHVAAAEPDGHHMVFNSNSISTSHHRGNMELDYTAFAPVARVSIESPSVAADAESGWEDLDDLKAAVEEQSGPFRVGISGRGAFTHLAAAALFDAMGVADDVLYIPYGQGRAPAELMAGRVDAAVQWPGQFRSYAEAGDLNILAVTSADRVDIIPDVASAQEQGYDVDIAMWRGLAVPAGTPSDVIQALQDAAKAATETDRFAEASRELGFTTAYLPADEFGEVIAADDEAIAALMADLGLTE